MRYFSTPLAVLAATGHHLLSSSMVNAAAMFCDSSVPCTMDFDESCPDAITTYRLYGSCCSLQDTPSGGCQLTLAGSNVDCYYRDPGYTCIPEEGCLPEFNVISADTPGQECPSSPYEVPTEYQEPTAPSSGSNTNEACVYIREASISCTLADTNETIPCSDISAPSAAECATGLPVYGRVRFSYDLKIDSPAGATLVSSLRYRDQMTTSSQPYERKVPASSTPGTVLIPADAVPGQTMYQYTVMDWEIDPIDLCDPTTHETTWTFEHTAGVEGGANCVSTATHSFAIAQETNPDVPPEGGDVCNLVTKVGCFLDSAGTERCETYSGDCSTNTAITVYYRYQLQNPAPFNSGIDLTVSRAVRVRDGKELTLLPANTKIAAPPGGNTFNLSEEVGSYTICGRGAAAPPPTTLLVDYTSSAEPSKMCSSEEVYNPAFPPKQSQPSIMSAGDGVTEGQQMIDEVKEEISDLMGETSGAFGKCTRVVLISVAAVLLSVIEAY